MISKNKNKFSYACTNCAFQTVKWLGCCPECKMFNTLDIYQAAQVTDGKAVKLTDLMELPTKSANRIISGIKEWDRVSGGGIVPGGFIILTGDPGIGKSTLLLQIAYEIAKNYKVLYFSSEESLEQVKLRAQRLNCLNNKLLFSDHANLDDIIATAASQKPDLLIIDSIQNCFMQDVNTISSGYVPGSIAQLKESAFKLMRLAKTYSIAIIISGHITKDGIMAGPKTLEHMVDAVFYLQGEDRWQTRVLRSVKNRFGTINELGFFQMEPEGLIQVPNINQQLLEEVSYNPGSILISFIEGSRPLLIELQALVIATKYGIPQRVVSGIDQTQVILIAAILEKYLKLKFGAHDLFFKISGSFKIKSAAADLGIALALLSSYFQKKLPDKSLALGEISLTGMIKPINYMSIHASEAEKFGITQLIVSKNQKLETSCQVLKFKHVYELLSLFE